VIQTAVIGLGSIGRRLAHEVRDHPEGQLDAVVDVSEEQLRTAREEFSLLESSVYTDEAEMYARTDLDAVVIATPPAFHDEQIHDALDRGLHVLCEKPVVVELDAAKRLHERVSNSELVFFAGYQRHVNPGFIRARERYVKGDHEPHLITGELTQDWTDYFEHEDNWRMEPDIGGRGHLFSVGTHVLESVLWMTSLRPETVSAEMEFHDDEGLIDKISSVSVHFKNGAVASFADSAISPVTREHIHVWDDSGAVYLDGKGWDQRRLTVVDDDGSETKPDLPYDDAQTKFDAFVESIQDGTPSQASTKDVLVVTALLAAAYESARRGEQVSVDLEF